MENKQIKLLFIGAGRMAQAMISGLVKEKTFSVTAGNNQNTEKLKQVEERFGISVTPQWKEEVKHQDAIVLAMPPEAHEEVLKELAGQVDKQLIITIAAGIQLSYLEERLPAGTPVVGAMPNTAADLGKSITLYAPGAYTSEEDLEIVHKLLAGIGTYQQVTEEQFHLLTAITGSAPAFIYELAAVLEKMVVETGITSTQARHMVASMIDGSAAMLKTGTEPAVLSAQVATPGGSTAAGLEVLNQSGLEGIIRSAILACREKSSH